MKGNWFTRTILAYVPAVFMVFAFLFFAFFQALNGQNQQATESANDFMAAQAMRVIDASLSSLDQKLTLEMLRNQEILRYFTSEGRNDLVLQVDVMNVMRDLKVVNPLIDSIYMVRADDALVLNESTAYDLEAYADREFVLEKLAAPNSRWSAVRTYRDIAAEPGRPVVTITRSVSIFEDDRGLLVVNVGVRALQELVKDMYDPSLSEMHLYDQTGADLFAAASGVPAETDEKRGDEPFAASYTSEYTGWTLESHIRHAGAAAFIRELSNVWFYLGIVVCVASLGWIVYVARVNYRPIRTLVHQLKSISPPNGDGGTFKNEFTYINSTLESMIERNNRFQSLLTEDMAAKRNFFLYELLEGTRSIGGAEWAAEAAKIGLPADFGRPFVFVAELDRAADLVRKHGEERLSELKTGVEGTIAETAEERGGRVSLLWIAYNQLAGIAATDDAPEKSDLDWIEAIRRRVGRELPLTVSFGVGETVEDPANLRDSYLEALQALEYKMVKGGDCVISYASASGNAAANLYDHLQRIGPIVDAFRLSHPKWRQLLDASFAGFAADKLSRQQIGSLLSYLLFHFDNAVNGMGGEYRKVWKSETLPALYATLKEEETLDGLARRTAEAFEGLFERFEALRESRNQRFMLKEVKRFIDEQYDRPEMSLEWLSDKFGISSKYLSKLFKEEFGWKFVDYLIELRIRQAKRLLAETQLSVQEIAEKIGYTNSISFARTFKKIVGMPPGDFRKET